MLERNRKMYDIEYAIEGILSQDCNMFGSFCYLTEEEMKTKIAQLENLGATKIVVTAR